MNYRAMLECQIEYRPNGKVFLIYKGGNVVASFKIEQEARAYCKRERLAQAAWIKFVTNRREYD